MNTVYEIIGWVSIPVTLFSVVFMVVTWRRERNLTARSLWIPIFVSSFSLLLYVRLIGLEVRPVITWLPFFAALGLGLYIGHASRVEAHNDAVVAARNPWSFLVWAGSFVATQLVALLAPGSTETMLALLFAATGLTIGEQLALVRARSGQLGQLRTAAAAAAALFLVVALGAALAPREGFAADVSADLGKVAGMRMDDGTNVSGMDDVFVDVRGVPEGTYSGSSIDVTIENLSTDTLKVRVPVGTRLYPEFTGIQTMLTAGNEVIEVPPGQTVTKRIQAYCGEASDGAPSDDDSFTVGEVVKNPALLKSMREMSRRFNNPDPDQPADPRSWQRNVVWPHTDPGKYQPPTEGEPGYDLFNPQPSGPSTEQSGRSGGAVGGITGVPAVAVAAKPSRSGKGGAKKKSSGTGPRPGGQPEQAGSEGSGSPWDEATTEADGGPQEAVAGQGGAPWDEPTEAAGKGKAEATAEATVESEPTDEQLSGGYKRPESTEAPPEGADETDPGGRAETQPEQKTEGPTIGAGPITLKPGQYRLDTGGGAVSVDTGEKKLSLDSPDVSLSYDLDDNIGSAVTANGKLKIDTQPGQFKAVEKDETGTKTLTGTRDGDEKSLTLEHKRTDGGRDRTYGMWTGPTGSTASLTSGQRTDTLHVGDDWWIQHQQPGVGWTIGGGDSGTQLSYQRKDSIQMFGEDFDLLHGVSYADDQFNYTYQLEKEFGVKLFKKVDLPLKVTVSGVAGEGSGHQVTFGPTWKW